MNFALSVSFSSCLFLVAAPAVAQHVLPPVAMPLHAAVMGPAPVASTDPVRSPEGARSPWCARNDAQRFEARFHDGVLAVRLGRNSGAPELTLALDAVVIDCEERVAPRGLVGERQGGLLFRRDWLDEWYVDGPSGLEQGFTIQRPPRIEVANSLTLRLAVGGSLRADLAPDGRTLELRDARNVVRMRYGGLRAWDATARILPSRMALSDGMLSLVVDVGDAVYPVTVDPTIVTAEGPIVASDGALLDGFGTSVDLASATGTAVVGAPQADLGVDADAGAAYVFVESGGAWTEQAKLTASDAAAGDLFGSSVSVSGNTVVVGAPWAQPSGLINAGAAYVFVRSGTSWTQQAKLVASDAGTFSSFGSAVAVLGDTLLVGAEHAKNPASTDRSGVLYVFERSGTVWTQVDELVASDAGDQDFFGSSVFLQASTAIVGAKEKDLAGAPDVGAAYVFTESGGTWTEQAKLTASDAAADDGFGWSVGVWGNTAVVGSYYAEVSGKMHAGAAYVFQRVGATWTEEAKLTASDGDANENFGSGVAVQKDRILIGAVNSGPVNNGAGYLYERSGTSWVETAKLESAAVLEEEGGSVAMTNDRIFQGAAGIHPASPGNGSVYVYAITVTAWTDLGYGLAGGTGVPVLTGTGTLLPGSSVSLVLSDAKPSAPASLVISTTASYISFKGGTLVPTVPSLPLVTTTTAPVGDTTLAWLSFPAGVPSGTEIYVQYVIKDSAAVAGYALSNALRGDVP